MNTIGSFALSSLVNLVISATSPAQPTEDNHGAGAVTEACLAPSAGIVMVAQGTSSYRIPLQLGQVEVPAGSVYTQIDSQLSFDPSTGNFSSPMMRTTNVEFSSTNTSDGCVRLSAKIFDAEEVRTPSADSGSADEETLSFRSVGKPLLAESVFSVRGNSQSFRNLSGGQTGSATLSEPLARRLLTEIVPALPAEDVGLGGTWRAPIQVLTPSGPTLATATFIHESYDEQESQLSATTSIPEHEQSCLHAPSARCIRKTECFTHFWLSAHFPLSSSYTICVTEEVPKNSRQSAPSLYVSTSVYGYSPSITRIFGAMLDALRLFLGLSDNDKSAN